MVLCLNFAVKAFENQEPKLFALHFKKLYGSVI